jgi:hypothetical protein
VRQVSEEEDRRRLKERLKEALESAQRNRLEQVGMYMRACIDTLYNIICNAPTDWSRWGYKCMHACIHCTVFAIHAQSARRDRMGQGVGSESLRVCVAGDGRIRCMEGSGSRIVAGWTWDGLGCGMTVGAALPLNGR